MAASIQTIIVDTEPKLISLLDKLSVGQNLGRHGTISILSLFIYPGDAAYLIDVHTLKGATFITANEKGTTLKDVLESSTVPKGFFDIRNDSDALFSLFGIKAACVHDIQLMELARRKGSKRRVCGLAKCIEMDLTAAPDKAVAERAISAKRSGEKLWNPRLGGTHAAFNQRPMPPVIIAYCSADIAILPCLWKVHIRDLGAKGELFWRFQVRAKTLDRIKESQKASYDSNGGDKSLGPSDWQPVAVDELMDHWNENIFDMVRFGDSQKEIAFGQF